MDGKDSYIRIQRYHDSHLRLQKTETTETYLRLGASEYYLSADPTPYNLTATVDNETTVLLDWDDLPADYDPYDVTFTVFAKNTVSGEIEQEIDGIQLSEAEIMGLAELEEYEFWVVTVVEGRDAAESNHVFATPESQQPDAPANFNVELVPLDPTTEIIRVIFAPQGVNGELHESPISSYSPSLWVSSGLSASYGTRDIHVDCVSRRVVVSANGSWPSIYDDDLDNPSGFSSLYTNGWNAGMGVDEVEGFVYACNTYENIYKVGYDGQTVDNYHLFRNRRGRPLKCEIDSGAQWLIVSVGNETNRIVSFDLSDRPVEDKEFEIEPNGRSGVLTIEKSRGKVLYREIGNSSVIRWSNYDATENERLIEHNEAIRWIRCLPTKADWVYFSTETGLYGYHIESQATIHILETSEIGKFDLEYEV